MKKLGYLLFFLIAPLLSCSGNSNIVSPIDYSNSLDNKIVKKIKDSVYEVIVPKSEGEHIKYEKELPLDLIPYAIRTDKYHSIGTAFAIGPNKFLSAAHVVDLYANKQFNDFYLRNSKGDIYAIDKVSKYSSNRDFVLFSVDTKKPLPYLETTGSPKINTNVLAVGNALGQGIIIRDGLYTSNTPEEEEGKWDWMRFSAAASPGNSGGPLLDTTGKVIGLVLRKSPNENLNIALPISEVIKAPNNRAVLHIKMKYFLDNMDMTKIGVLHKEFPLPKSLKEINRQMIKVTNNFTNDLLQKLLQENKENIFPRGEGSFQLLNSSIEDVFPNLIMKESDGNWGAYYPKEIQSADLGNNAYLRHGNISNTMFLYMRKPDNINIDKFTGDSKLFMDMLLKGIYLYREIGSEKIKITSLGAASEDYEYVDSYKRKWLVRTWLIDYSDEKIVAFMLPVPGGFSAMVRLARTGQIDMGHIADLKAFTDFIYLSYYGTLQEWKSFLELKTLIPPVFSTINIDFKYSDYLKYKSKRLAFSYTSDLMDISDKSYLKLAFGYYKNAGKLVWDVANIYAGEHKNNNTYFYLSRNAKPPKSLNDNFQSAWDDIVKLKFPYNASSYYENNGSYISSVYRGKNNSKKKRNNNNVLYTVWHRKDGKVEESKMKYRLNKFLEGTVIYKEN